MVMAVMKRQRTETTNVDESAASFTAKLFAIATAATERAVVEHHAAGRDVPGIVMGKMVELSANGDLHETPRR